MVLTGYFQRWLWLRTNQMATVRVSQRGALLPSLNTGPAGAVESGTVRSSMPHNVKSLTTSCCTKPVSSIQTESSFCFITLALTESTPTSSHTCPTHGSASFLISHERDYVQQQQGRQHVDNVCVVTFSARRGRRGLHCILKTAFSLKKKIHHFQSSIQN